VSALPEIDAISLRVTPYGEADLIVTFLGAEGGKIAGMARAARKSRRRFGAGLDPGNRGVLSYTLRPRSDLATVEAFSEARPPELGANPVIGFAAVSVALEATDLLSVEDEDSAQRFAALTELFAAIARGTDGRVALALFLATALSDAGYAPSFERCVRCGGEIGQGSRFDAARAGVSCGRCGVEAAVAPVGPELAARIAALTPESTDAAAGRVAAEWLGAALQHATGRGLKSLAFFREIGS